MSLYENLLAIHSPADRRFIELTIHYESAHQSYDITKKIKDLLDYLVHLDLGNNPEMRLSGYDPNSVEEYAWSHPEKQKRINSFIRHLPYHSVIDAITGLLDDLVGYEPSRHEPIDRLLHGIHTLAFCFKKRDGEKSRVGGEQVEALRDKIKNVLFEQRLSITGLNPAERDRALATLIGIYLGYRESGNLHFGKYSGLVVANEWFRELYRLLDTYYNTGCSIVVAQTLFNICGMRFKEIDVNVHHSLKLFRDTTQHAHLSGILDELKNFLIENEAMPRR